MTQPMLRLPWKMVCLFLVGLVLASCGQVGGESVLDNSAPPNISLQIKLVEDQGVANQIANITFFVFIADAKGAFVALDNGESFTCNTFKLVDQKTGYILNNPIPVDTPITCMYSSQKGSTTFEIPAYHPIAVLEPTGNTAIKPGSTVVDFQPTSLTSPVNVTVEDQSHQQVAAQQVPSGQLTTTLDTTKLNGSYTLVLSQQFNGNVSNKGEFSAITLDVQVHTAAPLTWAA